MKLEENRWFKVALILVAAAVTLVLIGGIQRLVASWRVGSAAPTATASPGGSAGGPSGTRTCLDGTEVTEGDTCADLKSSEVMFKAVGVDRSDCTTDTQYSWNAPGQSYACTVGGVAVRVARYRNADSKAGRVGDYGRCVNISGGWKMCGPNPSGRFVRTYVDDDLLFYVSSTNRGALEALNAVSATTLRNGR